MIENTDDYENISLEDTSHGVLEVAEFGFIDPTEKNMLPKVLQTPEILDALQNKQPTLFYTQL